MVDARVVAEQLETTKYPVTLLLLLSLGVLACLAPLPRPTYRTLIEQRQWHLWWASALSDEQGSWLRRAYIAYVLWSVRALEDGYGRRHPGNDDPLTYARVWWGLALCATGIPVGLLYGLQRVLHLHVVRRHALPDDGGEEASAQRIPMMLERSFRRLRSRPLPLDAVIMISALMMVHRIRLPHVALAGPWTSLFRLGPNLSYAVHVWMLYWLGSSPRRRRRRRLEEDAAYTPLYRILYGTWMGWAWSHWGHWMAEAFWGNALLLVGVVGSGLSLWAATAPGVGVGCNARGRLLIWDAAAQRWLSDDDDDDEEESEEEASDRDAEDVEAPQLDAADEAISTRMRAFARRASLEDDDAF